MDRKLLSDHPTNTPISYADNVFKSAPTLDPPATFGHKRYTPRLEPPEDVNIELERLEQLVKQEEDRRAAASEKSCALQEKSQRSSAEWEEMQRRYHEEMDRTFGAKSWSDE